MYRRLLWGILDTRIRGRLPYLVAPHVKAKLHRIRPADELILDVLGLDGAFAQAAFLTAARPCRERSWRSVGQAPLVDALTRERQERFFRIG